MKGRKLTAMAAVLAAILALCSCEKTLPRLQQAKKVFIIYACGHNNLSSEIQRDIKELCESAPSPAQSSAYKMIVFSHKAKGSNYSMATEPVLMEVYKDKHGHVVMDTLKIFQAKTYDASGKPSVEGYTGSDTKTLKEVLAFVQEKYPADEYGILFSSHGTGWLPYNYYATGRMTQSGAKFTFGADYSGNNAMGVPAEMDAKDFAAAIVQSGIKFKYILMDACFMGGVEVIYELRGIADYVMASPTEVYSGGFGYKNMIEKLMVGKEEDLVGLCEAYMKLYNNATITVVDTRKMDNLALVCKEYFEKYRSEMDAVNESSIQAFFRREFGGDEKHWFYDLEDILVKSGMSREDRAVLETALDGCIIYKAATERLFGLNGNQKCETYCGLSMFLPKMGGDELKEYYKDYQWNKDTALVK